MVLHHALGFINPLERQDKSINVMKEKNKFFFSKLISGAYTSRFPADRNVVLAIHWLRSSTTFFLFFFWFCFVIFIYRLLLWG